MAYTLCIHIYKYIYFLADWLKKIYETFVSWIARLRIIIKKDEYLLNTKFKKYELIDYKTFTIQKKR